MNADEAARCLGLARSKLISGDREGAIRLTKKSISLSPSHAATTFLDELMTTASSSSTESHASSSTTHHRRAASTAEPEPATPRGEDGERVETVRRIRACKATAYYEILGIKRSASDAEIKKAFRKLAILTHPDKSDVKGADEAFKLVGRAWQVLGDPTLKAQYDEAPDHDPTSRFGGGTTAAGPRFAGAGGAEVTPEELFNMFFGGGGGGFGGGGYGGGGFGGGPFGGGAPMFTATFGPNGFQRARVPRAHQHHQQARAAADQPASSRFVQLLPLIILLSISFLSSLPNILSALFSTPDPGYTFVPSSTYSSPRMTTQYKVGYYVNPIEFMRHPIYESLPVHVRATSLSTNPDSAPEQVGRFSQKLRAFESGVERVYVSQMRNMCNREAEEKERRMESYRGFLGIGADWEKVAQIRAEPLPSCEKLRTMGLLSY